MTPGMADMDIGIYNLNVIRYLTTSILFYLKYETKT